MQGHRTYIEPRPVIRRQEDKALVRRIRHIRESGILDRIRAERQADAV